MLFGRTMRRCLLLFAGGTRAAWQDGLVRCHYPFGDPLREEHRARDRKGVAA